MMALGVCMAAVGGIATVLSQSQIGMIVGGLSFVIILFALFFMFWRRKPISAEPLSLNEAQTETQSEITNVLMIEVSELGRVRRMSGNTSLIPALKIGQVADDVLLSESGQVLENGDTFEVQGLQSAVIRGAQDGGQLILIIPQFELADLNAQKLRERTAFFAGLGHDLKSPLNAVIGFSDIMDAEIKGPLPDAYRDYPGLIRESADTLLRLVEDMLGFAKSEAGTYEIDKASMDIAASGETVFRQSKTLAERAGVELVYRGEREVLAVADARAVQRIWDNLVSNAIKYSQRGDRVEMEAKLVGEDAVICVTDHGAGMSEEDLARIAAPFEQGMNARGRAGTGLGLAMVKTLAEMHDGRVAIQTALGEGTKVTVRLPSGIAHMDKAAE